MLTACVFFISLLNNYASHHGETSRDKNVNLIMLLLIWAFYKETRFHLVELRKTAASKYLYVMAKLSGHLFDGIDKVPIAHSCQCTTCFGNEQLWSSL